MNSFRKPGRGDGGGPRAAFTLVEVSLALGIAMIIFFVAASTVRSTSAIASRANATLDVTVKARAALDIMERDLAGAFLDARGELFHCDTDTPVGTSHDAALGFWTTPPAAYDPAGSPVAGSQLYYFVDQDSDALVRYDFPTDSPIAAFTDIDPKVLLYGVTRFQVRYYDPYMLDEDEDPWQTSWDTLDAVNSHQHRRLPPLVHVVLEVVDRSGYLSRLGRKPFRIEKIMKVGTNAPAQ